MLSLSNKVTRFLNVESAIISDGESLLAMTCYFAHIDPTSPLRERRIYPSLIILSIST